MLHRVKTRTTMMCESGWRKHWAVCFPQKLMLWSKSTGVRVDKQRHSHEGSEISIGGFVSRECVLSRHALERMRIRGAHGVELTPWA